MERALAESDALRFLDEVREEFWGHPEVYNQFLDTMKAYKRESLDVPGVIERVSELFHGKPTLIQGFNLFCPKEHQIDVLPDPNPMA
ncbi:hypothetical protein EST38_g8216 [Candolleomyces aberdarensis]|uniref:Uncharacterized protein n=1 Tax=Candolleomyces aberdarensis TaxID=2316362 RepID=A0A4Q2DD23_9AGAR|nr:hypothetical protein EST38_g8216 [Candolleomyces aberdarensis]